MTFYELFQLVSNDKLSLQQQEQLKDKDYKSTTLTDTQLDEARAGLIRVDEAHPAMIVIKQVYTLHGQIDTRHKQNLFQLLYFIFGNQQNPDLTVRIMDLFCIKFEKNFHYDFYLDNFLALQKQYSLDVQAWQILLWDNPASEKAIYFLLAPMIEHALGRAPTSLDEVEQTYQNLHQYQWSSEALYEFFQFSYFVKNEATFFEKLSNDNAKVLSQDLGLVYRLFLATRNKPERQAEIIEVMQPQAIDLTDKMSMSLVFDNLDKPLRLRFVEKLGIDLIIRKLENESALINNAQAGDISHSLRYFMENAFKTEKDRLQFFQWLPNDAKAKLINTSFNLKCFLNLFNDTMRFELCKNELKDFIAKIDFNPYTLAYVVALISQTQRVNWLKEFFTPEEIIKIKTKESNSRHYWRTDLKVLFTPTQWHEVRSFIYPGDALKAHQQVSLIRHVIKQKSVCFITTNPEQIPKEDSESYRLTSTNIYGGEHIEAFPPMMKQVEVLREVHDGTISKQEGLRQIKAIGQETHNELSNATNRHRLFYSAEGLKYFEAFKSDDAFEKICLQINRKISQ